MRLVVQRLRHAVEPGTVLGLKRPELLEGCCPPRGSGRWPALPLHVHEPSCAFGPFGFLPAQLRGPVLFLAGEHDRRYVTQRNLGPAATWKGGIPRSIPRLAAVDGTGARLSVQSRGVDVRVVGRPRVCPAPPSTAS